MSTNTFTNDNNTHTAVFIRLQQLRERLAELSDKDSPTNLEDLVSDDIALMRCLLSNCGLCLDAAERALRPASVGSEPTESSVSVQSRPSPLIRSTVPPVDIGGSDPVIEDEARGSLWCSLHMS